jgi:hypothetical protein
MQAGRDNAFAYVSAARSFDPAEHFDTDAALVDRAYNRIRKSTLHTEVCRWDAMSDCMHRSGMPVRRTKR